MTLGEKKASTLR